MPKRHTEMHVIPTQRLPWQPGAASSSYSSQMQKFLHVLVLPSSFSQQIIYGVGEDTALIREINGRKRPERIRYMPILIVIRGEKLASADPCDGMGGCCPTIPASPAGKCEASKFAEVQVGRSPKYETRRYRAKQAEQQMGSRPRPGP